MKLALQFFLKVFAFMSLGYGSTQALMYYFSASGEARILQSLISGLGFGLMVGLFITYKQMREVKKLRGNQLSQEDLSVHQVACFQSYLTKEEILAKLQNHYPSKDWELQTANDLVKLKTPYSWKSFGEKVQIRINELQNGLTEVLVESKPRLWYTLADYGKNLENTLYLRKLLAA
ncbi:hypothetical protein [Adhaeribacter soli]|uniref:DUF1499 domain-containing protein n=1 Tax=Adhaeribacter soli TaxID=2607655 RepID=A0A5N1J8L6_9BACT|nr:hypothetical protein [Adhaeribacter soli]KAA9341021.1 hypothetical protein F0P94_06235 [Adhaeribacter soli]